jgi:hypothetical protein
MSIYLERYRESGGAMVATKYRCPIIVHTMNSGAFTSASNVGTCERDTDGCVDARHHWLRNRAKSESRMERT